MLALRHRDDPRPSLDVPQALVVDVVRDPPRLATLMAKPIADIERRIAAGHHAYVASVAGVAASFGWVATSEATIGELGATLRLPDWHRYLWNFVTLPAFRGRGIYPRLLQSIIDAERASADWLWIMYAPENHASASGIRKAGFTPVAQVSFDAREMPAFRALGAGTDAMLGHLLGLPRSTGRLTPCWKCVRAGRGAMACADGQCHCDYQRPATACEAAHGTPAQPVGAGGSTSSNGVGIS